MLYLRKLFYSNNLYNVYKSTNSKGTGLPLKTRIIDGDKRGPSRLSMTEKKAKRATKDKKRANEPITFKKKMKVPTKAELEKAKKNEVIPYFRFSWY